MSFCSSRSVLSRVALVSALLLPISAVVYASSDTAGADEGATAPVLLQVELERDGRAIRHPGHMATPGETAVLTFTIADVDHDIEVLLEKAGDGFDAKIVYRVAEKSVLEGSVKAKGKRWAKIKQKKVSIGVRVDPDAKRVDGLELPDTDDPLGGAK
jgi:hypothetical protein